MKKTLCFSLFFVLSFMLVKASVENENKALVDTIAELTDKYPYLLEHKTAVLDSLKSLRQKMTPGEQRIQLGESLGRRYLTQNIDSALMYWRLARREAKEIGNCELEKRLNMNILAAMPLQGMSIEAIRDFEKIDTTGFSNEMKHIYWLNNSELYYNIQRPYPNGKLKTYYRQKAATALDSLTKFYPPNSPVSGFVSSYLHQLRNENNLAAASFLEILPSLKNRPELYSHAIMNVVDFYRDRPEYRSMYLNNLYKSAINGLRNGNANPQIIGETGEALCDEGYVTLGSKLMLLALQTSENKLGSYAHLNHSADINHLYNGTVKTQLWTMAVILVLVILLSIAIMRSHRHKKMMKSIQAFAAEEESRHINEVKDMHKVSASLLSMALFTDEQLKEYNLFVHRKLKAGQAKDLFMEVQSGEYIQSLSEKFFAKFDESFLDSFPGFIDKLNSLFSAGRELTLLPGRRMSPELRIAAFMRLGINDSAKLSQVLGLSINTIYTYRNRLKGRAIDRKNFDRDVQSIAFDS